MEMEEPFIKSGDSNELSPLSPDSNILYVTCRTYIRNN